MADKRTKSAVLLLGLGQCAIGVWVLEWASGCTAPCAVTLSVGGCALALVIAAGLRRPIAGICYATAGSALAVYLTGDMLALLDVGGSLPVDLAFGSSLLSGSAIGSWVGALATAATPIRSLRVIVASFAVGLAVCGVPVCSFLCGMSGLGGRWGFALGPAIWCLVALPAAGFVALGVGLLTGRLSRRSPEHEGCGTKHIKEP